jgi:hypothetical protein
MPERLLANRSYDFFLSRDEDQTASSRGLFLASSVMEGYTFSGSMARKDPRCCLWPHIASALIGNGNLLDVPPSLCP